MPATDDERRDVLPTTREPSSTVTRHMLAWVEHAVIGLNLCPFAKAPWVKGQVRCVVSASQDPASLLEELRAELQLLVETDPRKTETTLLVVPDQFAEFDDFNQFLDNATNRAPYPTLHLLRENSIERAVEAFPQAEAIYETNIRTLRELGESGWAALQKRIGHEP